MRMRDCWLGQTGYYGVRWPAFFTFDFFDVEDGGKGMEKERGRGVTPRR